MFKTVLHANDGSEPAFRALTLAIDIAKQNAAALHLVCVEEIPPMPDNVFQFGADPLRAEMASGFIDEAISVRISTKVLYAKPTVREQAAYCAAQREHR